MPKYQAGDIIEASDDPGFKYEIIHVGEKKYFYRNVGAMNPSRIEGAINIGYFDDGAYRKVQPFFEVDKKYQCRESWSDSILEIKDVYEHNGRLLAVAFSERGVVPLFPSDFEFYQEVK